MEGATIRAKMYVNEVKRCADSSGETSQEEIKLSAVYGKEGTANNQWSKYTPCGSLTMTISNPSAFGKLLPGQYFFVDLIPTEKDSE